MGYIENSFPQGHLINVYLLILFSPRHMEFLCQGSDPSCNCSLCRTAIAPDPLTHCVRLEWNPCPGCRTIASPITPQQELQCYFFLNFYYYYNFNSYFPNTLFSLLYSMVIQLHIHVHILFSHIIMLHHRCLDIVPSAT